MSGADAATLLYQAARHAVTGFTQVALNDTFQAVKLLHDQQEQHLCDAICEASHLYAHTIAKMGGTLLQQVCAMLVRLNTTWP